MKTIKYIERLSNLKPHQFFDFADIRPLLLSGKAGTSKYTDDKLKTRFYLFDAIEEQIDSIDIIYSEKAKIILYSVFDLFNIKKFRNIKNEDIRIQAMYSKSGVYRDYAYVDIKDNHFTIIKRFLLSQYEMNAYLSRTDKSVTEYLSSLNISKRVKRSTYGIMRSNMITSYKRVNNEIKYSMKKAYHQFYNPDVCNLIADISHAIAIEVINNYKAVYYNTDGMIVPKENIEKVIAFLNELGFEAKIKHIGDVVEIKTIGCYRFDNYSTLNYNRIISHRDFSNLDYNINRQFLFKRLSSY
jgi:hypothetical protein